MGIYAERCDPREYGFQFSDQQLSRLSLKMKRCNYTSYVKAMYKPIQAAMKNNGRPSQYPRELRWFYHANIDRLGIPPKYIRAYKKARRLLGNIKRSLLKKVKNPDHPKRTHLPRIRYIDIARGIAMLCIILGHLGVSAIDRVVYTFHVPIFYIFTGYFISSRLSPGEFARRKARTLLVPYAVTCGAIVALAAVIAVVTGGNPIEAVKGWLYASAYGSGGDYFRPFYIKRIGAIWFLLATFWGSVFLRMSLEWRMPLRLAGVTGIFLAGWLTAKRLFWFPLSIQAGCCAALFMYAGYCARQCMDDARHLPREGKAALTVLATAVWIAFIAQYKSFWLVQCDVGRGVIDIVGCLCACYCVVLISRLLDAKTRIISGWLAYLGRYSLIMLCIHVTEMNLIDWWQLVGWLQGKDLPYMLCGGTAVVAKLALNIGGTVLLSRSDFVRRLFAL